MRIHFSMKTPDTVDTLVRQRSKDIAMQEIHDGSPDEPSDLIEEAEVLLQNQLDKYFSFGEYLNLVLDTETGEMTVIKKP